MFMLNHPLEGKREAKIKCMDIHAMNQLYGTDPLFIFDPDNKDNRPLVGYQDNALVFWDLYPGQLRELFTASFTVGLREPNRRVTETKWLETFANMMSGIITCPHCGAEVLDHMTECPRCKKPLKPKGYTPLTDKQIKKIKIITFSVGMAVAIAVLVCWYIFWK